MAVALGLAARRGKRLLFARALLINTLREEGEELVAQGKRSRIWLFLALGSVVLSSAQPGSAQTYPPPLSPPPVRYPPPPLPSGNKATPTPITNPGNWITPDDYPAAAWVSHAEGPVGFELLIDPRGKVSRCTVTSSSGFAVLDQAACKLLSARASFSPGHDASGKAISGTYRSRVRWVMPEAEPGTDPLTDDAGQIHLTEVIFTFVVETDGSTSGCTIEADGLVSKPDKPVGPCLAEPPYQPFTDTKGHPVRKRVTYTVSASAADLPRR